MTTKIIQWVSILACLLMTGLFFMNSKTGGKDPVKGAKQLPQVVQAIALDEKYTYAGEVVPIENFDVKERLERELLVNAYWHSSTLLAIKHVARFFPDMERILEEENVPRDFIYLAVAESSLRPAVSPAGAKGLWQIMKPTGLEYKLEITEQVDERYHVEKATRVACRLLKNYKAQLGSWTLAAAAYNTGIGRVSSAVKTQRSDNYYDLHFSEETNRYVFRLLAFKTILENPEKYGYYVSEDEVYPPVDNVKSLVITQSIPNLGDFAKDNGTSYRMLKMYNPWLTDSQLTVKPGKEYVVLVPN